MKLAVRPLADELRFAAIGVTVVTVLLFVVDLARDEMRAGAWIAGGAAGIIVLLSGLSRFDRRYDDPQPWPENRQLSPVAPFAIRDAMQMLLALALFLVLESQDETDGTSVILPLILAGSAAASWRTWFRTRTSQRRLHRTLYREVAPTPKWIRAHGKVYAVTESHPTPTTAPPITR